MNAETVARLMSLIPERTTRFQGGATFELAASTCRYPERLAHVAKFLHWMSPLESLSNEDQQVLGLRNAAGRPVHAADLEDDELDGEAQAGELEDPAHADEREESMLGEERDEPVLAEEIAAPEEMEEESALV